MPSPLIVVIGASAGGVEALSNLLRDFPRGGRAAFFVTLHVSRLSEGLLPRLLGRASGLPASSPQPDAPIQAGHIYVAPPDYHLLVGKSAVRIDRGPRENSQRPAIDPLFRSAANAHGAHVIGIILTGTLDDGAAGLLAVKRRGGITLVQDPDNAPYADMPWAAITMAKPHRCSSLEDLRTLLQRLAGAGNYRRVLAGLRRQRCPRNSRSRPSRLSRHPGAPYPKPAQPGTPTSLICPECHGPLFETKEGGRFACVVGHSFSPESLMKAHNEDLERALWTAVRTLEEHAALHRRLAGRLSAARAGPSRSRFLARAQASERAARRIRKILSQEL